MEKPIIFKGEMVRAILDGWKTQTRRVIKPQILSWCPPLIGAEIAPNCFIGGLSFLASNPYGRPGDRLWVKETFALDVPGCSSRVTYRADHIDLKGDGPQPIKWSPSIFMPRKLSRITLEIIKIRVERVQEITDNDIHAEGLAPIGDKYLCFADLWDSIYAKQGFGWGENPWVWVIEFMRRT